MTTISKKLEIPLCPSSDVSLEKTNIRKEFWAERFCFHLIRLLGLFVSDIEYLRNTNSNVAGPSMPRISAVVWEKA